MWRFVSTRTGSYHFCYVDQYSCVRIASLRRSKVSFAIEYLCVTCVKCSSLSVSTPMFPRGALFFWIFVIRRLAQSVCSRWAASLSCAALRVVFAQTLNTLALGLRCHIVGVLRLYANWAVYSATCLLRSWHICWVILFHLIFIPSSISRGWS